MRTLFLDLDGTLTDPAPGIAACFVHTAHVLGHGSISLAEVRRFIGPPLREAFAEILATRDSVRIEEAVRVYRERFGTLGLFENSVYAGVPEALAQLCQAGHGLCLVTSKAAVYAERIVDHFGLRAHVPRVYGAELSGERSTKAELIAHALERESLTPADACMIGDREHDILGAKVHGLVAIGVTWGYGSRAELEAAGADRIVDTLEELVLTVRGLREMRGRAAR
ncbi:HAD hydrolase-like protein [Sorangium sp. So ce1000]|uniref:HAD hydrolase-like protein n=1 Tax=Sorangium sp. So ce1000 TaxID=3133325 RepID=UPI003F6032B5